MKRFRKLLAERNSDPVGRRWLYVPYDQLSDRIGPLSREDPAELAVLLIENPSKAARRPYHRQKLAYVLANQRHFALELAERGVAVDYCTGDYRSLVAERAPLRMMEAAELELRDDLKDVSGLSVLPHEGWLSTREQFQSSCPSGRWKMDAFYRRVRQDSGILMERGRPVGGKYSFDAENRQSWKGQPPAPVPPTFPETGVKREVVDLIEKHFTEHPGKLDLEHLPATADDARTLWHWARRHCLSAFGPYEDAMSTRSSGLFHTRISALLNLHRLLPVDVVRDVAADDSLPLACREGFVRQILGWREYVRHVHRETRGFRDLAPTARKAGDGGYATWAKRAWKGAGPGGAAPEGKWNDLPPAYWGEPCGLNCLDTVVADVWREGYSHHITRLMVLSNIAMLLDVSPRQLTDWFWVAYVDAYDWVVEPNVLGMGTFSLGPLMTTKPYVAGSGYINRMSDFCAGCRYDPKDDCPLTPLYWAYLERHREQLADIPRMTMPLRSLAARTAERKHADRALFEKWGK